MTPRSATRPSTSSSPPAALTSPLRTKPATLWQTSRSRVRALESELRSEDLSLTDVDPEVLTRRWSATA